MGALLVVLAVLSGCGARSTASGSTHAVVDSTGASVRVPETVNRVADGWPAHNEVDLMLGAGHKIVSSILTPSSVPWLYVVDPSLARAKLDFTSTSVNVESLLTTKPDVLFTDAAAPLSPDTTTLGVPDVQLGFQTFSGLKTTVSKTAQVLGGGAPAIAAQYNSYLNSKVASISAVTSKIPEAQRPSVLHIYSLDPLVVDGTNTIIDQWITLAGGRNAAQVSGATKQVTEEQVAQWNPDVIVLASSAFEASNTGQQTIAQLESSPFWSQLPAVVDHHVYVNPTGGWRTGTATGSRRHCRSSGQPRRSTPLSSARSTW
ncbi:MAG: ABC transporter substrate-binding protein [Actinomycetota bacterium]